MQVTFWSSDPFPLSFINKLTISPIIRVAEVKIRRSLTNFWMRPGIRISSFVLRLCYAVGVFYKKSTDKHYSLTPLHTILNCNRQATMIHIDKNFTVKFGERGKV